MFRLSYQRPVDSRFTLVSYSVSYGSVGYKTIGVRSALSDRIMSIGSFLTAYQHMLGLLGHLVLTSIHCKH